MTFISTKIVKPGSIVKNVMVRVFTWGKESKTNVNSITLEFDDGSLITYNTEIYLDLPDGNYYLIDDKYIKIK